MPTLFVGDTDIRNGTLIGDGDPAFDDRAPSNKVYFTGQKVGVLNRAGTTWGWFEGGFRPSTR